MLPKRRCENFGERAYCKGIREEEVRGSERWARVSETVFARRRASRGKRRVSISAGVDRRNGKSLNKSVETRCTVM